jgi:hypothetical protein
MSFEARAISFVGTVPVAATVHEAFPLFSPVGEQAWVPGWKPERVHPPGVEWARGQIFRTEEERGEAIWIVARLDREQHEVEYYRVEPGRYVARIEVACRGASVGRSDVSVAYSFVGLSEIGNADIAAMSQAEYDAKMRRWAGWIADHLATSRRRG